MSLHDIARVPGPDYWSRPLTAAEHEGAAKRFLQEANPGEHNAEPYRTWCLAAAQVHATLAGAAATREAGDGPDLRAPAYPDGSEPVPDF